MLVFTSKQIKHLREAGLLPYPTPRDKLEARQSNARLLDMLKHPTRAERKRGDRLIKWLTTTK